MLSDNVDDSKIVEDVNILPKITRIVKDALVDSGTPIINKIYVFSDRINDDVDKMVESNVPVKSSKLFKFPCGDYEFMVVPTELSPSERESLAMIQQIIFDLFFY